MYNAVLLLWWKHKIKQSIKKIKSMYFFFFFFKKVQTVLQHAFFFFFSLHTSKRWHHCIAFEQICFNLFFISVHNCELSADEKQP